MKKFMKGDKFMEMEDDREKTISEKEKQDRWNKIHSKIRDRDAVREQYDGWLEMDDRIKSVVKNCKTPIIELGCGSGQNTLHLVEEGKRVIACDFSDVAIEKIKENIPEARAFQFNMKDGFPFPKEQVELEIADLCLHYFNTKETMNIIKEARELLVNGGHLIMRVNSCKDTNFGAGQGRKLEENFYEVRGTTKRFFDEESLKQFFPKTDWRTIVMEEGIMGEENIRTLWQEAKNSDKKKKILWTCMFQKK